MKFILISLMAACIVASNLLTAHYVKQHTIAMNPIVNDIAKMEVASRKHTKFLSIIEDRLFRLEIKECPCGETLNDLFPHGGKQ